MDVEIKIGVYICHCGQNIAGTIDVSKLIDSAVGLQNVTIVRDHILLCSSKGQELIRNDIRELGVNRVVVAACSPQLHEQTFQHVLTESGLNPYLLQIANIREQCAWIHKPDPITTEKANRLIRAVKRVAYHLAEEQTIPVSHVLVLGGIADSSSTRHREYATWCIG
jgi:heterodisulfide reductase subunit A